MYQLVVPAQHRIEPDARLFADTHQTNDIGTGGNEATLRDLRDAIGKAENHGKQIQMTATSTTADWFPELIYSVAIAYSLVAIAFP